MCLHLLYGHVSGRLSSFVFLNKQQRHESCHSSQPKLHFKKTKKILLKRFSIWLMESYTLQCGMWLWDYMPQNQPKCPPYWNSKSGFDFDHITAVDMSFCTSLYPNRTTLGRKNDVMSIFKMADLSYLGFQGSKNGFFEKRNNITSYRSSIDTIALNCLVFQKIAFFCILATHKQTDEQTDRRTYGQHRCSSRSRCRERRLNNLFISCT